MRDADEVAADMAYLKADVAVRGDVVYFDTYFLVNMATDILNFRFMKEGLEQEVRELVVGMIDPGKKVVWVPTPSLIDTPPGLSPDSGGAT